MTVGPGNTFLRNRVESYGIRIRDHSHFQNVIGNEFLGEGYGIEIHESVEGTFLHGNYVNGTLVWNPDVAGRTVPVSLSLTEKPGFFGDLQWPVTGTDLVPDAGKIPAQIRFEEREAP